MPRRKPRAKTTLDDEEDEQITRLNRTVYSDSDDEAANEDLTLKIIEKAKARASGASAAAETAVNGGGEVVVDETESSEVLKKKKRVKKVKKSSKKKKKQKIEEEVDSEVPTIKTEELGETTVDAQVVNLSDPSAAENVDEDSNVDNVVLRRLLRGPRYFDPPDKSWGTCFNCGEEGHAAVNCTSARRKRPCFICGSLEHEVKQCQKGQDCFICKAQGHRARDCPQKMKRCSLASELCLKCGAYGHMMFSCDSAYSPDDLKDIQCYVCKRYGHLCCANYFDALSSEASCYKCGLTGHYGQDCRGSKGETSASGTPSSCFKCGEEGHFARECKTSTKAKKRTRERDSSTNAGKKYSKDKKSNKAHTAPQEFFKNQRKKFHYDDESPDWSSKPKRRGGWTPEDSNDHYHQNGWRSPATPNKNHRIFDLTAGGHGYSPQYYTNKSNYSHGSSSSRGYGGSYEHRYTASRFGYPTDSRRRNNDWW